MKEYKHSVAMGKISGFGEKYEETCQNMLNSGVQWLVDNIPTDLRAHSFSGIFGILIADSAEAKAMEAAVLSAPGAGGCSGAMHYAVMSRLFYISEHSWEKYCDEVLADNTKEARNE